MIAGKSYLMPALAASALVMILSGSYFLAIRAASAATVIQLQSQDIKLPGPGTAYTGQGADVLNQNCALCHSPTFVNTQPALSAAAWQAEVLKMKNVFGAPIAVDSVPVIVKVLLERHGTPTGPAEKAPSSAGASG